MSESRPAAPVVPPQAASSASPAATAPESRQVAAAQSAADALAAWNAALAAASPVNAAEPRVASASDVLALFLKTARATQLYPRHSKIRGEALTAFSDALVRHLGAHGETVLVLKQFRIECFGEAIYEDENRQKSLAFKLFGNGVRAIRFTPGLDAKEAEGVTDVLTLALAPNATLEDLQTAIWERCFEHALFEISEEGLSQGESEDFTGFVSEGVRDDRSAYGARGEAKPLLDWLASLPATPDDEWDLAEDATQRLAAAAAAELHRDAGAEAGEFLLDALRGGYAADVRGPLEEYFEVLLHQGEVLRAARMLAALRAAAAASGDPQMNRAMIDVVERIGRSKFAPALESVLEQASGADREGLAMLLLAVGEPAVEPLCSLLGKATHEHALASLRVLAGKHIRAMLRFCGDSNPAVARAILALVLEFRPKDAVASLMPALRHGDIAVRRDAMKVLTVLAPLGSTDLLLSALDDPLYEIRATSLDALGTARDPRAVAPLLARIASRGFAGMSAFEKREIFRAVGRIGSSESTAALAKILQTKGILFQKEAQDEQRCLAAAALALVQNPGARAALNRHVEDGSERVRRAAAQALREIDRRSATSI